MITIDTHAHWFPPQWLELLAAEGNGNGAEVKRNAEGNVSFSAPGYGTRPKFGKQYVEIPIRLKIMDEGRVDMHALSFTSPMVYWAKPEFGLKLSRVFNDACADVHLKYPNRFIGMATVPMQAPAARGGGARSRREAARHPRRLHGHARQRQESRREGVLARLREVRGARPADLPASDGAGRARAHAQVSSRQFPRQSVRDRHRGGVAHVRRRDG